MTSQEIRQKYLDFFRSKGHHIVPSAPIVLKDDPTLMFSNSGMTQFKDFFLGYKEPTFTKVADTQKCLRVSGKHNDLDDVGRDTYHHTMFEMLGNWSFGDYFKKEAIAWAWELLTEVYKIPKENIYVTIFEGDATENLERDREAYDFWKEHISEDRIINGNKKDNFWEMGEQGPCGPCSEIHVDLRSAEEKAKILGKDLVNKDHPQVVEIWNLVFMEFNRKADGSLEKLPKQNVDTGMGFERLCMALQGKSSNYDTDVFTPLIERVEELSGKKYTGKLDDEKDIAIRVIVDHIRAVSFAIADGQFPSNTGAGYVIRRILRRAVRYAFTFLEQKEPFFHKLVRTLVIQMGEAFPELEKNHTLLEKVIKEEEVSFLRTLEQGLLMLDAMMNNAKEKQISGNKAFELYDTYGFPIDLTMLILAEKGYTLDEEAFEESLRKQKERSRVAAQMKTDDWVIINDDDDEEFIGYDTLDAVVRITRYRKVESQKEGVRYHLVFNVTPFYPEGGGQVGDRGILTSANGETTYIFDTKKENNLIIHIAETLPSKLDDPFKAEVVSRFLTEANHTATHLLHQALREILGTHVKNTGDIWYFKILSEGAVAAGVRRIEAITGEKVKEYLWSLENQVEKLTELLKSKDLIKSVEKVLDENTQLKSELEQLKREKSQAEIQNWKKDFIPHGDKQILVKRTSLDTNSVKDIVFQLKREIPTSLIVILSDAGEKPMISVGVSADLENKYHAGNIVKELAKEIQGGGGGNVGFATAGGKNLEGLVNAEKKALAL